MSLFSKKKTWKQYFDDGMAHGNAGNTHRAAESFRQAIALAPNEPYPHYELGYTFFLQGKYQEALQELKTTNRLTPGFFLVQQEIYLCESVIAGIINKEILEMLRALQRLTDMGGAQSNEVIALSRKVIELAPSCALGYFYLGKALAQNNREVAEKALRHCLSLAPDDTTAIDAKIHLGLLRQANGDLTGAHQIWQSVIADYKDNPHTKMCEVILSQHKAA